jgi:hypothetical protein
VVTQLDDAADLAGRTEHHVPGQTGDLIRPQPGLADSSTITRLRSRLRVQLANSRRSLTSVGESIFARRPGMVKSFKQYKRIAMMRSRQGKRILYRYWRRPKM